MDLEPPPSPGGTIIGEQIPFGELGLTPFTPSRKHMVALLDTIIFYKLRKNITKRSEKRLNMGSHAHMVIGTENTIMEGTHKDPKFMASMNIEFAQANADNIDHFMENVEHHKEKMLKLKDTLVKTRGEGIELKRKHEAILLEK